MYVLPNKASFSYLFLLIQRQGSQEANLTLFPQVSWQTRMKQLWLVVWWESNIMLERYFSYTDKYYRSLNGLFNGTISYRGDSFIRNNLYGWERRGELMCYLKERQQIYTRNAQQRYDEWNNYENSAAAKPRYNIHVIKD